MFSDFANVWTPVALSRALKAKPLPVKVAGEKLVLFRDGRGGVGALLDRCPHRGVALSLGEVDADGCLSCPFHGWAFRADGSCTHVPFNDVPEAKRERHAATAVPVRDVGGLLWVFTGPDPAGTSPEPAPAFVDPAWNTRFFTALWNVHWTRAMENMLDMPHVPFIHRRSIGRQMRKDMKRTSVLEMAIRPETWGAAFQGAMDGVSTGAALLWRRPNAMELHISTKPGRGGRVHIFCVPVDADHTLMILGSSRDFFRHNPLMALLDYVNRRILFEDRDVVESSQPSEVPPAAEEISVPTDGPTLHFRRYYYRELRGSTATLVPEARLTARRASAQAAEPARAEEELLAAGAEPA